jgi:hypothetical protein
MLVGARASPRRGEAIRWGLMLAQPILHILVACPRRGPRGAKYDTVICIKLNGYGLRSAASLQDDNDDAQNWYAAELWLWLFTHSKIWLKNFFQWACWNWKSNKLKMNCWLVRFVKHSMYYLRIPIHTDFFVMRSQWFHSCHAQKIMHFQIFWSSKNVKINITWNIYILTTLNWCQNLICRS